MIYTTDVRFYRTESILVRPQSFISRWYVYSPIRIQIYIHIFRRHIFNNKFDKYSKSKIICKKYDLLAFTVLISIQYKKKKSFLNFCTTIHNSNRLLLLYFTLSHSKIKENHMGYTDNLENTPDNAGVTREWSNDFVLKLGNRPIILQTRLIEFWLIPSRKLP